MQTINIAAEKVAEIPVYNPEKYTRVKCDWCGKDIFTVNADKLQNPVAPKYFCNRTEKKKYIQQVQTK